jgi:preprotein translocase subunit SecY
VTGQGLAGIVKIPELKKRILFTLAMLAVYRVGSHIPVPGVETAVLADFFRNMSGTMLKFFDMFTGSNFSKATIFAMGIMPYISSSIIMQLLTVVVPTLEKLKKEGEQGQKKMTQYTRYGAVVLASVQGLGISFWLEALKSPTGQQVVASPGWAFRIITVITLAAGTAFIMWLGEQITERGVGNGISLIIFGGIVTDMPKALIQTFQLISINQLNTIIMLGLLVMMLATIGAIVFMESSHRRLTIQYAKRQVGRKMMSGSQSHLPLKFNTSGVIPPIFASSIIMFPATIGSFISRGKVQWLSDITDMLRPGHMFYETIYVALIFTFCYFYTQIIFNPTEVADNLKKGGGFIPGIRPGHPTADHISRVLDRLTFTGAIYLSIICIIPNILISQLNVPFYFGGTGLLIVVGVGMDTMSQVEAHLVMRHYEGFVKRGSIRSRR